MGAAIVGGLISAIAVVIGVYLAQALVRRHGREERLWTLVGSISNTLTPLTSAIWDLGKMTPEFAEDFLRLTSELIEAGVVVRGLGKKRIAEFEPHLTLLNVLLIAAVARSKEGTLSLEEYAALLQPIRELNRLVRPAARERYDFLGHLAYYAKEGLNAPDPQLPDPPDDKAVTSTRRGHFWDRP